MLGLYIYGDVEAETFNWEAWRYGPAKTAPSISEELA